MDIVALIYILIAGTAWGSSCLFVNAFVTAGFSPLQTAAVRNIGAALLFLLMILITDCKKLKVQLKELILMLFAGACLYGTGASYYASIALTSACTAVVLMYTAPIMVMIVSVAFLGEQLTWLKAISALGAFVGCGLVTGIVGGIRFNIIGIFLALLSGVLYAAYNILVKIAMQKKNSPTTVMAYCFFAAALCSVIGVSPTGIVNLAMLNPAKMFPLMFAIGCVTSAVPYFLYSIGLKRLPAGVASSLGAMEPTMATVFSILFLGERLTGWGILGIFMILASVVGLSRSSDS